MLGKQKKEQKLPDWRNLWRVVVVFVLLGLAAYGGIFFFLRGATDPEQESLYDVAQTAVVILGVVTVGGAAAIQYRKQRVLEQASEMERDTKCSERLTKAIEHLGHDTNVSIRIGAVYELKRLAEDSAKDREDITKILSAFVRMGIEPLSSPQKPTANGTVTLPRPGSDIFIAADILSLLFEEYQCRASLDRLYAEHVDLSRISLNGAYLREAVLNGGGFDCAKLNEANLRETELNKAELNRAELIGAELNGAKLNWAELNWAELNETKLIGAELNWAELNEAKLNKAKLNWAKLIGAKLMGAELNGAELIGAELIGAELNGTELNDVDLNWADLRRTTSLTIEQLETVLLDKNTKLDPNLSRHFFPEHPPTTPQPPEPLQSSEPSV
jgi:uncharacterized protein YjbI with pentapeptide repeats